MKSWILMALSTGSAVLLFAAPASRAQEGATDTATAQIVHVPDAAAARKAVSGTLTIEAVLTANKYLAAGSTVTFNGGASVYDTSFTNMHSITGVAKVRGGKVSVTLKIPYTFLVIGTSDKVSVNLSANANAETKGPSYNFSSNFQSTIALPANGAATVVKYSGSI
jgi:hypothetical protein